MLSTKQWNTQGFFERYGFYGVRSPAKLLEHSIKSGGNLENVGDRIVAIASMNTCKH